MYVCVCKAVNERMLEEAVSRGARDLSDLATEFGLGQDCGRCKETAETFLDRLLQGTEQLPTCAA